MPDTLLLTLPGNEAAGAALAAALDCSSAAVQLHRFPDGETRVTLPGGLLGRRVVLVCSLDRPDGKLAPLLFAADAARELGALEVGLAAPYLAYLRQDARFAPGQAISSRTFCRVLDRHFDFIATVDPHLHRHPSLEVLFDIPAVRVAAAPAIAGWIAARVERPLLIGPDGESAQWIADVAERLDAPYRVQEKRRDGDADVTVSPLAGGDWQGRTPILLDDILSTGRTMLAAIDRLHAAGLPPPLCIAIHAVLAGEAWARLQAADTAGVFSCNTIAHPSNAIDVMPLLAGGLPVA